MPSTNKKLIEFLGVSTLSVIILVLLILNTQLLRENSPDFKLPWDHSHYYGIAIGSETHSHQAPFCWRIFTPYLARVLPFGLEWNFFIVTFMGLCMTGVVLYYINSKYFNSKIYGLTGLLMFYSLGWATKFVIFDFWLSDAAAFFFISLSFYFAMTKNDKWFLTALLLGVIAKESVIFVAPVYYFFNSEKLVNFDLVKRTLYLITPALIAIIIIKILIPGYNPDYKYILLLQRFVPERLHELLTLQFWNYITIRAFGIIPFLLIPFSLRVNTRLFIQLSPFLFLVFSQIFLASNIERLLVIAFPAVILMANNGIKSLALLLKISPMWFIGIPLFMAIHNIAVTNITFNQVKTVSTDIEMKFLVIYLAVLSLIAFLKQKVNFKRNLAG